MRIYPLLFLCGAVLSSACSDSVPPPTTTPNPAVQAIPVTPPAPEVLAPGTVHADVSVKAFPNESFAYYSAAGSSNDANQPILFGFDPQGEAVNTIQRYQALADTYGLTLVVSNNSRNGMPADRQLELAKHMISDVMKRQSEPTAFRYTFGFSGGSSVALLSAQSLPSIRGAIGCASPYTQFPDPLRPFTYVGIVGYHDFNFWNQTVVDSSLNQSGVEHALLYFDGIHEWPDEETFGQGLRFLALRDGWPSAQPEVWFDEDQDQMRALKEEFFGDMVRHVSYMDRAHTEHARWNSIHSDLSAMMMITPYRSWRDFMLKTGQFESQAQGAYAQALQEKDKSWWESEIKKIIRDTSAVDNREERRMNHRLLSFLSMAAYMQSHGALNQNLMDQADVCLTVYELADPKNAEHAYLRAVWHMRQRDKANALISLQKAQSLGFSDGVRLQNQPELSSLQQEPVVLEMLDDLLEED